jgi:hypothetical protein
VWRIVAEPHQHFIGDQPVKDDRAGSVSVLGGNLPKKLEKCGLRESLRFRSIPDHSQTE